MSKPWVQEWLFRHLIELIIRFDTNGPINFELPPGFAQLIFKTFHNSNQVRILLTQNRFTFFVINCSRDTPEICFDFILYQFGSLRKSECAESFFKLWRVARAGYD